MTQKERKNFVSFTEKHTFALEKFKRLKTMKKLSFILALALAFGISASAKTPKIAKGAPVFKSFTYTGNDAVYNKVQLKSDETYQPILQGCYPDPSICRKGNDYYMVCSSFAMFPGVPIFHSTDMMNWKQIGHVLDRVSQLELHDCGIAAGIYAPQIIYNKVNDTFYMITTEFSGGFGNIVVKTKDPMQGWSDPYKLNFDGIDPSLFFDEDGKGYVVHNDAPEPGTAQYPGHRVIKVWDYDVEKDQVVAGSSKVVVNGGVDITKKPDWIEAPHIYKRNGWYYLMCAEGGTGDNHSEVIFRAKSPKGPYVPAPSNPILSQRHLPADRANKIDWAGHADLVDTPSGDWYAVFLGIRPNEKSQVATGRETFLLPVDWSGDFPVYQNGLLPLDMKVRVAGTENKRNSGEFFQSGNWTYNDTFNKWPLDYRWIAMRGPREEFIAQAPKAAGLAINPSSNKITDAAPISALFHRQQHSWYTVETELSFQPKTATAEAGLCLYQSEKFNYILVIALNGKDTVLRLVKNAAAPGNANTGDPNTRPVKTTVIAEQSINAKQSTRLKVEAQGDKLQFFFAQNGEWQNIGGEQSASILTTDVAGGFTGNLIGLYATK